MIKGFKNSLVLLVAIIMVIGTVLAGCGNNANDAKTNDVKANDTATNNTEEKASDMADNQVFRMNLFTEPGSLDPALAEANTDATVLWSIYEPLVNLDENNQVQPGMAEKWEISDDGLTYTFHIRQGAKWSNGDPVTAHDFEYAWKRALDPKTASTYAYILYYVKNGEAYNTGKITDAGQVGVKATDDQTLVVSLENATSYFLKVTNFYTYMPLNQKAIEGNPEWAAEANTMVTNGPFTISEWRHSDAIVLKKNENYYDAKSVNFTEVDMAMVGDPATEASMFDTDQLDWNGRPVGEIPIDLMQKFKADGSLQIKPQASVYYYLFNVTQKPFDNVKIRKALAMAINRQQLVDKVAQAEQLPAYGVVTPGISGKEKTFREEHPDSDYFKEDVAEAKKLLQEGLRESGLTKLPVIPLSWNTNDNHKKIALAIADMWKQNLGAEVKTSNEEFKVFLKTRHNLDFGVARAGWIADYDDANTFLDMYTTGNGQNDTGYSNPEYDKLIADAAKELDAAKRQDMLAQAEKILIADDMVVMPIYYYTSMWRQKDNVKNVFIDSMQGNIHLTHGYIAK